MTIASATQTNKNSQPRFISLNELNSFSKLALTAAVKVKYFEYNLDKAKNGNKLTQWSFLGVKHEEKPNPAFEKQIEELKQQLNDAKKEEKKLKDKMSGFIAANEAAYQNRLNEKEPWKGDKLTESYDPVARELSSRVSVDNACLDFVESKIAPFVDIVSNLYVRKDKLARHYDRLVGIVNWADRLKDSKHWSWLKAFSNLKGRAAAGTVATTVLEEVTRILDPIIGKLEQFVKLFPKTQEGKELAGALVRPVSYFVGGLALAVFGYLSDLQKERMVKKFESRSVMKQENVDSLRIGTEGLFHQRFALQFCDIKLGHGQIKDVEAYNPDYAALFRKNPHSWTKFYKSEARRIWQETQERLSRTETGPIRRIWNGAVQMLKDTVWWMDLSLAYNTMKIGDGINYLSTKVGDAAYNIGRHISGLPPL